MRPEGSSRWPRERLIRVVRRILLFMGLGIPGALVFVASCIMVSMIILSRTPLTSPDAVRSPCGNLLGWPGR